MLDSLFSEKAKKGTQSLGQKGKAGDIVGVPNLSLSLADKGKSSHPCANTHTHTTHTATATITPALPAA